MRGRRAQECLDVDGCYQLAGSFKVASLQDARVSVIAEVVAHRIMGKGVAGYLEALEWLAAHAR